MASLTTNAFVSHTFDPAGPGFSDLITQNTLRPYNEEDSMFSGQWAVRPQKPDSYPCVDDESAGGPTNRDILVPLLA